MVLSIDFDFFISIPRPDDERVAHALQWVGDEWWPAAAAAARWYERAQALHALGIDPTRLLAPTDHPSPEQVAALLAPWIGGDVILCDSHAYGVLVTAEAAARAQARAHVISLDAHHDLGYINYTGDTPAQSRARARTSASCDDWLAVALRGGWATDATIVYPPWRGLEEWHWQPPTLGRRHRRRVTATVWEDWAGMPRPADVTLIVRSSEWTPPWGGHDQRFLDFATALSSHWSCLDCRPDIPRVGAHNACHLRDDVIVATPMT